MTWIPHPTSIKSKLSKGAAGFLGFREQPVQNLFLHHIPIWRGEIELQRAARKGRACILQVGKSGFDKTRSTQVLNSMRFNVVNLKVHAVYSGGGVVTDGSRGKVAVDNIDKHNFPVRHGSIS